VEPAFHADSYGYRPGRSAVDAIRVVASVASASGSSSTVALPTRSARGLALGSVCAGPATVADDTIFRFQKQDS
jgi:hypothetical protein